MLSEKPLKACMDKHDLGNTVVVKPDVLKPRDGSFDDIVKASYHEFTRGKSPSRALLTIIANNFAFNSLRDNGGPPSSNKHPPAPQHSTSAPARATTENVLMILQVAPIRIISLLYGGISSISVWQAPPPSRLRSSTKVDALLITSIVNNFAFNLLRDRGDLFRTDHVPTSSHRDVNRIILLTATGGQPPSS
jgi:hypothetical protein